MPIEKMSFTLGDRWVGQGGTTVSEDGTDDPSVSPRFLSNAHKLGYCPPLDGMRGLAVILVVLVHASFVTFASFAASVDMFFLVSGFLITTLLLEEDRRFGSVNLRHFYQRRALRLLPLMYLILVTTLLAFLALHLAFGERELLDRTISDVLAGGGYIYHVIHPVHSELVGGGPAPIRPLIQLWSLSVEEHFYVFGVLVIGLVVRRRWVNQLMVVFLAAWLFIGAARLLGHVGPNFAWYQRPDSLLLGVVVAFVNAKLPADWSPVVDKWMRRAASAAVVIMWTTVLSGTLLVKPLGLYVPFLVSKGGSLRQEFVWGEFGFSVVAACIAVMVITFVRCPDHRAARFLSHRWLTAAGVRSYAIYLIHVPLGVFMMETIGRKSPGLMILLYVPALALATEAAHRYVEKPAMQVKNRLGSPATAAEGSGSPA